MVSHSYHLHACDLLDRQFRYLHRQEAADFLRQLPRFLDAVSAEPVILMHLEDMRREAIDALRQLDLHDNEMIPKLVEVRNSLLQMVPRLDDSDLPIPQRPDPTWETSFAYFDRLAGGGGFIVGGTDDPTRSGLMVRILQNKVRLLHEPQPEESKPIRVPKRRQAAFERLELSIGNLDSIHQHARQSFLNNRESHPGISLLKLDKAITGINPAPQILRNKKDHQEWIQQAFREALSPWRLLRGALYSRSQQQSRHEWFDLDEEIAKLKGELDRVYEDARRRIGTIQSRLGIIRRFKQRCEWYDRDRLRLLAKEAKVAEDALTLQLALWLFDQGLNPLVKPRTGGLEPDILDPSVRPAVYVEAKRYSNSRGRQTIVAGARQLHDTVAKLQGTPYEIHEAFYVVFREGGPLYILPESISVAGYVMMPLLVDLAKASDTGSRQKHQPQVIDADDLGPQEIPKPASKKRSSKKTPTKIARKSAGNSRKRANVRKTPSRKGKRSSSN